MVHRGGHRARAVASAVAVSGLCAVLLVSLHSLPVPHGFVELQQDGPPLPLTLTHLASTNLQPRSWVSVTLNGKETKYGSSAAILPPPEKDKYADFDKEDPEDDENPHHIFMSQKEKDRGAVATWKHGAEAGLDDFVDDEDDNSPKYGTTVTVSPVDARVGAYVRYVQGGPPDAAQSDAAKAAQKAAQDKDAADRALDAEPLLRPVKINCSDKNALGLDPPPCTVATTTQPATDQDDDDVYD